MRPGVHHGGRRQQPLDQLVAAHLQAEHRDREVLHQRGVLGDAEREGGLAHAGTGGDDDHVARLQTADDAVEVDEAGGDADHPAAALLGGREALDALDHQFVGAGEVAPHALLREAVDQGLRVLEHHGGLALALDDHLLDLLPHLEQPPLGGGVAHHLGVGLVARRDEGRLHQVEHGAAAAGRVELAVLGELLEHGDRLHRLADREQVDDRPVHRAMALAVEVVLVDHALGLGDERAGLHQAGQEHRLGLGVLGRCDALRHGRCPRPRGAGELSLNPSQIADAGDGGTASRGDSGPRP